MNEIKQTNFRVGTETADAFRKFCEENGMNQAQGFDHLMQVLELNKAKAAIPNRQTEIISFEKSVKDIMNAYLQSLEINSNAEGRAREEFKSRLESNEKTISELNMRIEQLTLAKKSAEDHAKSVDEKLIYAQREARTSSEQAYTSSKLVSEMETRLKKLTNELDAAEAKASCYDEAKAELEVTAKNLSEAKSQYEAKIAELEMKLEKAESDAKKDAALATANAVMEKEREMQDAMRKIEMENAKLTAIREHLEAENDRLLKELTESKKPAKEEKAKK